MGRKGKGWVAKDSFHARELKALFHPSAMMIRLTPRQSTQIHGWLNPVPTLTWEDVKRKKLTFDFLLCTAKLRPSDLVVIQPDPRQWVQHAGASLKHARQMIIWPANPFTHLGADLADVLSMKMSAVEMVRMDITYAQLMANGMSEKTERLFRFDEEEWVLLGKNATADAHGHAGMQ